MRLHGLGGLAVEVEPYRRYELGPFVVSFTPSAHSKLILGRRVPFDGELSCDHLRPHPGRLPLRAGVGDPHRGRGMQLLPPGQREPRRRGAARRAGRRVPRRRRGPRGHAALLGAGAAAARPAIVVPTHYDDSSRSAPRWGSPRTSTSPMSPTRSTGSAPTSPSPRCRCWEEQTMPDRDLMTRRTLLRGAAGGAALVASGRPSGVGATRRAAAAGPGCAVPTASRSPA